MHSPLHALNEPEVLEVHQQILFSLPCSASVYQYMHSGICPICLISSCLSVASAHDMEHQAFVFSTLGLQAINDCVFHHQQQSFHHWIYYHYHWTWSLELQMASSWVYWWQGMAFGSWTWYKSLKLGDHCCSNWSVFFHTGITSYTHEFHACSHIAAPSHAFLSCNCCIHFDKPLYPNPQFFSAFANALANFLPQHCDFFFSITF